MVIKIIRLIIVIAIGVFIGLTAVHFIFPK
jgi:hypothetical protein